MQQNPTICRKTQPSIHFLFEDWLTLFEKQMNCKILNVVFNCLHKQLIRTITGCD